MKIRIKSAPAEPSYLTIGRLRDRPCCVVVSCLRVSCLRSSADACDERSQLTRSIASSRIAKALAERPSLGSALSQSNRSPPDTYPMMLFDVGELIRVQLLATRHDNSPQRLGWRYCTRACLNVHDESLELGRSASCLRLTRLASKTVRFVSHLM